MIRPSNHYNYIQHGCVRVEIWPYVEHVIYAYAVNRDAKTAVIGNIRENVTLNG
ncbi:hypothetical protein CEV32_3613 [Brucella rhizosphaerae]|uniref:Uncharacterized protein n=1 Tax=Brucella rhizosphaerae TaxID=571254 RepID=A0A256FTC3_9HYPH|nr:hypothetical protein CEV32_3613 [Brucella rhizosphaerae]